MDRLYSLKDGARFGANPMDWWRGWRYRRAAAEMNCSAGRDRGGAEYNCAPAWGLFCVGRGY
jgi:hypothetical protein